MKKISPVVPLLLLVVLALSTATTVFLGQHSTDNRSRAQEGGCGAYAPCPTLVPFVTNTPVPTSEPGCSKNGQCVRGGNCFYDPTYHVWVTIGRCSIITPTPTPNIFKNGCQKAGECYYGQICNVDPASHKFYVAGKCGTINPPVFITNTPRPNIN